MVNYAVVYRCAASFSPILTVPQRLKLKDVMHWKTYQRHMNRIYGRRTDYKCETDEPVCDTFILLPHIDYSCSNFVFFVFVLVLVFLCVYLYLDFKLYFCIFWNIPILPHIEQSCCWCSINYPPQVSTHARFLNTISLMWLSFQIICLRVPPTHPPCHQNEPHAVEISN